MRSTVYMGFGAVLIVLLVWIIYTNWFTNNDPVLRVARQFFAAVQAQNATACAQTIDSSVVALERSGNHIVAIDCADMRSRGALGLYPGTVWQYTDLKDLTLDQSKEPELTDEQDGTQTKATVFLSDNVTMNLHRVGSSDVWKIIYISAKPTVKVNGR